MRILAGALALLVLAAPARGADVTVFAAASLKTALEEVAAEWRAGTDRRAVLVFAGSSALARQIERGAPADLFVSANAAWMDRLDRAGLIRTDTRRDLLGNRLVLIAHGPAEPRVIGPGLDLDGLLGDGRLALALVDAVPAGIYAKAALESLGLWAGVAARVVQADNARAALALVALGEAPLGIVYATDARAEPRVGVVGRFPETSHPPIVYPAAVTTEARAPLAEAFLDHLSGPAAARRFQAHGFLVGN